MGNIFNVNLGPDVLRVAAVDNSEENRRFKRSNPEKDKKKPSDLDKKVGEAVLEAIKNDNMEGLILCLKSAVLKASKEADPSKLLEILALAENTLKERKKY